MQHFMNTPMVFPTYADELQPCPQCGGTATLKEYRILSTKGYRGHCNTCGYTSGLAIAAWHITRHGSYSVSDDQARREVVNMWNEGARDV